MKRVGFLAAVLMLCASAAFAGGTDIEFSAADGSTVFGEIHEASSPRAVILLFHQGGGDSRGEYGPIVPRLVKEGYTTVSVDLRAGGNLFKSENRTVARRGGETHYCEAWPDVVATFEYARAKYPGARIIAWGSSFSGALVLRLAAEHGGELAGVLAFSPAAGEPMGDCPSDRFAPDVKIPALALRPKSEAEIDSVREQLKAFDALGFKTYISDPGRHGSSMLVDRRAGGSTEGTWKVVLTFLDSLV